MYSSHAACSLWESLIQMEALVLISHTNIDAYKERVLKQKKEKKKEEKPAKDIDAKTLVLQQFLTQKYTQTPILVV